MRGECTRRRLLAALGGVGLGGTAGCLALETSVRAEGVSDSNVFEGVGLDESMATNWAPVRVRLTPAATTEHGVRGLSVIDESGVEFASVGVASGQTSKTVSVPVEEAATLSATDYDGATVEQIGVRVTGTSLF